METLASDKVEMYVGEKFTHTEIGNTEVESRQVDVEWRRKTGDSIREGGKER